MTRLVLATIAAVLMVPILGAVLGALQLAWYRSRVRRGSLQGDQVPFFGVLLLRGMMMVFALIALGAILVNLQRGPEAPPAHPG
jgi:hypothetical protein